MRSRNVGARQTDFSELLVNLFRLNHWFLGFSVESTSLSLSISFLFVHVSKSQE